MFGWLSCIVETIKCFANRLFTFLVDLSLYPLRKLWEMLNDLVLSIMNFPVPAGLQAGTSALTNISGDIGYFLHLYGVDVGMGIVVSCLLLRFMLRRIPLIG